MQLKELHAAKLMHDTIQRQFDLAVIGDHVYFWPCGQFATPHSPRVTFGRGVGKYTDLVQKHTRAHTQICAAANAKGLN